MNQADPTTEALRAASERRIQLKAAAMNVERAAAAPSAKAGWRDELIVELEDLRIALDQHVDEVEGELGLLAELTQFAPRLVNKIDRVRDEHPALESQVAEAILSVKESESPEETRSTVLEALVSIARHRQKGADLVYEVYSVDIGGG
jgi:hypothetical protein